MKRILVIAGSDSSGGAGLEADQKVIASHGCYAMTATAALTAQNTKGVFGIHETPSAFVKQQVDACLNDIGADVLKTGMLASAQTVTVVANAIKDHRISLSVVDPVMVATSGAQLLPEDAVESLCTQLLPLTTVVTPNIPEANLILRKMGKDIVEIHDLDSLKKLAAEVHALGPKFVLLKGGHCPLTRNGGVAQTDREKEIVVNVLHGNGTTQILEFPFQKSQNTHGTGCSLASALACNLVLGLDVVSSVRKASRYVEAGIKTAVKFGQGSGPINHFHSLQIQAFSPGGFVEYILERKDVQPSWHEYTNHEFVARMGDGTLPPETFKYYMIQDYLYLTHFARANALAGYKTKDIDDIAGAAQIVVHIRKEMELHIKECEAFGITQHDMTKYEESQACTAYSRYVLDIGQSEDWLALQISLLPCLLGYGMIASRLKKLQGTSPPQAPNPYLTWINNYVAEDYVQAVQTGCALIEKHAFKQSPSRIEELVKIFVHATKMETGFWNMASGGE